MVAGTGVEPVTFHFSGERCYQLSYPAKVMCRKASSPHEGGDVHRPSDPDGT